MRKGFTVLELLVASLLLSMLVTILTMIFNQSSIAWRTGIASVSDMEVARKQMCGYHDVMDDALPGLGDETVSASESREVDFRTISIFRGWTGGNALSTDAANADRRNSNCKGRAIDEIPWGEELSEFKAIDAKQGIVWDRLTQPKSTSRGGYIVGVRSAGPNRQMDEEDDITTYPEEID